VRGTARAQRERKEACGPASRVARPDLLRVLRAECATCRRLERLAEEEATALRRGDVDALTKIAAAERVATERLQGLEEQRLGQMAALEREAGAGATALRASDLRQAHLALLSSAQRLGRLANRQLALLRGAVEVTRGLMDARLALLARRRSRSGRAAQVLDGRA